jgi:hypothetical protein
VREKEPPQKKTKNKTPAKPRKLNLGWMQNSGWRTSSQKCQQMTALLLNIFLYAFIHQSSPPALAEIKGSAQTGGMRA